MGQKIIFNKVPFSGQNIVKDPETLFGKVLISQNQEIISSLPQGTPTQHTPVIHGCPDILTNSPQKILAVEGLLDSIGQIPIEQDLAEIARQIRIASQKRKILFLLVPDILLKNKNMAFLPGIKKLLPPAVFYALPSWKNHKEITVLSPSEQWFLFRPPYLFRDIIEITISEVQGRYILKIDDQSPSTVLERLGIDPKGLSNFFLIKKAGDSTSATNIKRIIFNRLELAHTIEPGKYNLGYFVPQRLLSFIEEACSRRDIHDNGIVLFLSLALSYKLLEKEKREITTFLQIASSHFIVIGLDFLIDLKNFAQKDSGFALIGRW